jgi:Guanine nucleotide exchange factor in Golgi transport N-terminal
MFVVDKVVEEDRRILLANELESITIRTRTTQALCPATCDAFVIFEGLSLMGNDKRPQYLRLEYLHKTFTLELIESVLTTTTNSSTRCVSLPLCPSETCMLAAVQFTLIFAAFQALTLITIRPLPPAPQYAIRALPFPACPLQHPCYLPLSSPGKLFSEIETKAEVFLTPLTKFIGGETDGLGV